MSDNPIADLAEDFGMRLFPWQRAVLDAWMADRTLVLTLPRKHGRTSVKQAMERARDQYRASMHIVDVAQIMRGETRPQLDSGHYRDCPTYDGGLCDGTCWITYHKHQPYAHRTGLGPPLDPCTCTYHLDTYRIPVTSSRYARVVHKEIVRGSFFLITWFCPHHGRGIE